MGAEAKTWRYSEATKKVIEQALETLGGELDSEQIAALRALAASNSLDAAGVLEILEREAAGDAH